MKTQVGTCRKTLEERGKRFLFESLEEHILYSADVVGGLDTSITPDKKDDIVLGHALPTARQYSDVSIGTAHTDSLSDSIRIHELVFIDTDTNHYQQLVDDLLSQRADKRQFEIFILDNQSDGIEQISDVLAGYDSLDAVHIISHGFDGAINIGATRLDTETLNANRATISTWGDAFDLSGDLLIYGCDLAKSSSGQSFVNALASTTGTDVAASLDLTGSALLGGDWDLEYQVGSIEKAAAISENVQRSWMGILAPTMTPVGSEAMVNTLSTGVQATTAFGGGNVAMDANGNYAVVWQDLRSGNYDSYLQIYNADGSIRVSDIQVHSLSLFAQDWPNVAMTADGNIVVSWGDQRSGLYEVYMRMYDIDGNALTGETQVSTIVGSQDASSIDVAADGSFVVVFLDSTNTDIYMQRYDSAGVAQGVNTIVNSTTASDQTHPDVAVADDGSYVVTWMSVNQDGSGSGIYAQRFNASGIAQGSEFRINQFTVYDQAYATVDSDVAGNFVVSWMTGAQDGSGNGIYARLYNAAGIAQTNEFLVNTTTAGEQGSPNINLNDTGDFIVTWHDANALDGSGFGIFAQQFDRAGNQIGNQIQINTTTLGDQRDATVAFSGSKAVMVWSGNGTGDTDGVFAQRFNVKVALTDILATTTIEGGLSINNDGGSDVYLLVDDADALLGGLTSLSGEVQFSSVDNTFDSTLFSYATATRPDEMTLELNADGSADLNIAGGSVNSTAIDYEALRDGSQHTVGFSWDGSNGHWAIYVDGVETDSTAIRGGSSLLANGSAIASGGFLLFGQEQDSLLGGFDVQQTFSGTLYDARFFDHVRTPTQMAASYRGDLPYDELGMIANWRFNTLTAAGIIVDRVSGNNLTVTHISESGFLPSVAALTLSLEENAAIGTVVGEVSGIDAQREAQITTLLSLDSDLRYSAETGKFYKLVDVFVSPDDARTSAESTALNSINGQLVTIRSAYENAFVADLSASASSNSVWIGGTDANVEGEWRWIESGGEADLFWTGDETGYAPSDVYQNWVPASQPNNDGGVEPYIRLNITTGQWWD
ncbi:MAG: DUF4347 domain-containing protein, partial [Granulosicoccus sp.]